MSKSKDKTLFDENDQKVGGVITATVEKSKFGPWPRKCEFTVDFRQGIVNIEEEIFELALKYNILKKPSEKVYEFGELKWTGRPKTVDAIKEDKKLAESLALEISKARDTERAKKREEQAAIVGSLEEEEE